MTTQVTRLDPPKRPGDGEPEQKIIIQGGRELNGSVYVGGAKNAVLKIMAAAILTKETCVLRNVPNLTDVSMMAAVIRHLGGKVTVADGEVIINARDVSEIEAPYELVSQLRASFVVLGPLVSRFRQAKVSLPGGCAIGERRIDLHERGLKLMGCDVKIEHGYVYAQADRLVGTRVYLDRPSNGATENIMMAAVLAEGQTVIENAAQDPEIVNLADFINAIGGKISGAGTYQITIDGVGIDELHGATFDVIPDRLEAGTFMLAAMCTGGEVVIEKVNPHHIYSLISKMQEMGAEVSIYAPDTIKVKMHGRPKPTEITTLPYPAFPTDLQSPIMAALAHADGTSIVSETIYENRFMQVGELRRMGADISVKGNSAVIKGVPNLMGAEVKSPDLRASAALILAGLGAQGITEVSGLHHLDRGYEKLEEKFRGLGANIHRR
ncbi:MAG: UDP-N-acetylglucosamine 1-carboxyvinyltransferase [Candidatus Obscuribacterales bacterium]|nr:UDP-N-acetylglucosamine 1-carboxyvinyltransferase [Candidatus Obscuribacterales bacterium]